MRQDKGVNGDAQRLERLGSDYYLIVGDSKIASVDKEVYIESNVMPMKYDLKGNISSIIKVNMI
jgi:hypothetical protein